MPSARTRHAQKLGRRGGTVGVELDRAPIGGRVSVLLGPHDEGAAVSHGQQEAALTVAVCLFQCLGVDPAAETVAFQTSVVGDDGVQ